jgi:5-methylcytosine-specific restriction endonuclease McrA
MGKSQKVVNCRTCGKDFRAYHAHIKRGGGKFCSIECKNKAYYAADLSGKRFHYLVVLRRADVKKFGKAYFDCECDCGNIITTRASSLRLGKRRSCGCKTFHIWEQRTQDREIAIKKRVFNRYKRGTWTRQYGEYKDKYVFSLTYEDFSGLIDQPCWYCGVIKANSERDIMDSTGFVLHYNGIDRVDNSKPYTIDNVVPCCKTCNKAKNSMSVEEFKEWITRVFDKFSQRAAVHA